MILVSVIVPIYNAAKYLDKCIQSILNQTYSNLEVILINDGSTDGSGKICDEYAASDKRIKVIHKENEGLINARKTGIRIATGDVVGYVDADDWIEPDFYSRLLEAYLESGADMVTSSHFHDIGEQYSLVHNGIDKGVYLLEEICERMLFNGRFFEYGINPHLCTKLFKRDILLKCQLEVDPRIKCGEDAAVTYPFLLNSRKVCVVSYSGYHYVQHSGSMTKKKDDNEKELMSFLFDYLYAYIDKSDCIRPHKESLKRQIKIYKNYMYALRDISLLDTEGEILKPYGGLDSGDRVVVYGAGVLGQMIYKYLSDKSDVEIVAWVDKNAENYQRQQMNVIFPSELNNIEFDKVLIANITYNVAIKIHQFLVDELHIDRHKVYWFTDSFQQGN